jgi:hypothetical protein
MMIALLLCLQDLRAGAAVVDATPTKFPVVVNGSFLERTAGKVTDPIQVRALALSDGKTTLVLAVVDSCMVPRGLIDAARAGIPHVMVSSTHTHSAPSSMGCLGTDADPDYPAFLQGKITEALKKAVEALAPAEAGWTSVAAPKHTYTRRWILRSDKVRKDPFGDPTVRAMMHPGYQNPDYIGPSGPTDPEMTILSVRARGGAPLAVLANYSMHYFDSPALSADYYGAWRRQVEKAMGGGVAILSQGTSGDQMWMDYGSPSQRPSMEDYAFGLSTLAVEALKGVEHKAAVALGIQETTLRVGRRTPDAKRLAWARGILDGMAGRKPKSQPEVYAREAVLLHETPDVELRLQALRVGDGLIAAWPNEVFALSGLKLKAAFPRVMNVSLANGAEGYIPPPEQHAMGGYTTWPARTAALELGAEPRIVEALLGLLEGAAGAPRRAFAEPDAAYAKAVLASKPTAYWRLGELAGPRLSDSSGNRRDATIEGGVALHLDGPWTGNRAVQLAGGRLKLEVETGDAWTAELWFWNGFPALRPELGQLIDVLGLDREGRLSMGGAKGKATTPPKTWRHLAVVREGKNARAYLDGELDLEGALLEGLKFDLGAGPPGTPPFEGRLDEVALYPRALSPDEIQAHFKSR